MRINSQSIHNAIRKILALEDISPSTTGKCLQFPIGRVMLCGKWAANEAIFLCSAARRTEEGGRNLNPDKWAVEEA
jgi:hypothetical protein